MNQQLLELALKKQRLQIQAQSQRLDMRVHLKRVESVLSVIDRVRDGLHWAREHTPILSAAALALFVLKPRLVLRIARRAWLGFMLFRNLKRRVNPVLRLVAHLRG